MGAGQVRWDDGPWIPVHGDERPGAGAPRRDAQRCRGARSRARRAAPGEALDRGRAGARATGSPVRLRRASRPRPTRPSSSGCPAPSAALRALGLEAPEATDRLRGARRRRRLAAAPRRGAEPEDRSALNDLTLGAAGVLLAGLWGGDHAVAHRAADVLLRRASERPAGLSWTMDADADRLVPRRAEMPNFSHGTAGVAAALAVAGHVLGRPAVDGGRPARSGVRRVAGGPGRRGARRAPLRPARGLRRGRAHLELVPRAGRDLAPLRRARPRGGGTGRRPTAGVLAPGVPPGDPWARESRRGGTRASGTTTAAVAAPPAWPTPS